MNSRKACQTELPAITTNASGARLTELR